MRRDTRLRRRWLRAGVPALVAALALGVAACGDDDGGDSGGSGGGSGNEEVRLGAFILASENTYAQKNLEGVEQAAEKAGNVTVQAFDGKFDGRNQLNQIQDAVASGNFDAFVVFPNDGAQVAPGVEDAAAAGIKTVAAYAPIGSNIDTGEPQVDGVIGTVWHPNRPNGADLAELTLEACAKEHPDAKPCKVAYISGGNEVAFEKAKLEEFNKTIDDSGKDVDVVSEQEGNFLQDDSLKATENILQANKDVNVITTSGDQMTLGAEQAVDDAGLTGKVSLIGNGAATQGVEAVRAGKWFGTPVYLPIDEGAQAAQMAIDAVRGKDPENTVIDLIEESPIGPFVTEENAKDFEAQWSG